MVPHNPRNHHRIFSLQVAAADAVLRKRRAAVAELVWLLDAALDLDAAQARLGAAGQRNGLDDDGGPTPQQLAALLGLDE